MKQNHAVKIPAWSKHSPRISYNHLKKGQRCIPPHVPLECFNNWIINKRRRSLKVNFTSEIKQRTSWRYKISTFFLNGQKNYSIFFLKLMGCWDGHDLNSYEKNYINHHDSRSPFKANDFIHYVRLSLSPIDTFCVLSLCGSPRSFTLDGGYHVQQQQPVFLVLTFFFVILTRSLTTRASVPHDFTSWGSPSLNKKKTWKKFHVLKWPN